MATEKVNNGCVVDIDYRVTVADGTEVDSTAGRGPMSYLHGHGNIVSGLERALEGKSPSDSFAVDIEPEDGYGHRDDQKVVEVPLDRLGFEPTVGDVVRAQLPDGSGQHLMVAEINEQSAMLDGNHPLAGEKLHFDVTVASIREASVEELEQGHPAIEEDAPSV